MTHPVKVGQIWQYRGGTTAWHRLRVDAIRDVKSLSPDGECRISIARSVVNTLIQTRWDDYGIRFYYWRPGQQHLAVNRDREPDTDDLMQVLYDPPN